MVGRGRDGGRSIWWVGGGKGEFGGEGEGKRNLVGRGRERGIWWEGGGMGEGAFGGEGEGWGKEHLVGRGRDGRRGI